MQVLKNDKGFNAFIISMNRNEQLYFEGIDIDGKKLKSGTFSAIANNRPYSFTTEQIKKQKGQPIDRVTLYDTGQFYKTFKIVLTQDFDLQIIANTNKADGDLTETWEKIIGLTEENYQRAIKRAQEILISYISNQVNDALKKAA
jgi:hypothetical protein